MLEKYLTVKNRTGLHARPAAVFVEVANRFEADIKLSFDGITVNGKSIVGVLSLGIGEDDRINLIVNGEDEKDALKALTEVISDLSSL